MESKSMEGRRKTKMTNTMNLASAAKHRYNALSDQCRVRFKLFLIFLPHVSQRWLGRSVS